MALAAGLFRLAQGRVRGVSPGLLAVFLVWFLLVAGPSCSPATPAHPAQPAPGAGPSSESLSLASSPDRPEHALAKVPVTPADPQWGNVDAPVTLVEVSDFECPFCARVQPTLEALKRHYGPQQLRLVWKHRPLPFHQSARPAHEVAAAVQML